MPDLVPPRRARAPGHARERRAARHRARLPAPAPDPGKCSWKSAKWLRGIELSDPARPGFWERYDYHNDADPFEEQRYQF